MQIISFDALRSLGLPQIRYIKPDHYLEYLSEIRRADWLIYPEYWQIHPLLYALQKRIFPSVASYHIGHDKIEQTRLFQVLCPRHIPETWIVENTTKNAQQLWEERYTPFVAKIPRSSEGRGVFLIENQTQWADYCRLSPVLYVQEYLPIDRDLRLVLIGEKVVTGYWRLQGSDGFHNNLAQGGALDFSPLPPEAITLVESVARTTGINHGGFDVAMLGKHPYLIEYNRLFGNQGLLEQDIDVDKLIYAYLQQHVQNT